LNLEQSNALVPEWQKRPYLVRVAINLGLIVVGGLIFALSFPSFLSKWGWFPLAYLALIPVAVLIHRSTWPEICFYGFLYGLFTYTIHNFWLSGFHSLALLAVPLIYATYFLVFFPLLKLADTLMPRYGYLLQVAIWVAYEYFRTQFYLGYSYGIIGYSQYLFLPLVRVSSLTGVWGVSLIVAFPGFLLGNALKDGWDRFVGFMRTHRLSAVIWVAVFAAALVFGIVTKGDYSDARTWRMALVQQNSDPLAGGAVAYRRSLDISIRLSEEALAEYPDVVVWSETSVVPPIDFHMRYRLNRDSYGIVDDVTEFLNEQSVPFIIGNSSARFLRNEEGDLDRVDYNAVIVHNDGEFSEPYRKIHLVPFTESFPFEKQFPRLYALLEEHGTNQWGKGDEFTVFDVDGVRFSTPICFEDTFGYISREFVRNGAELIVNLTNDLWSKSVVASMQHMLMAVFRATETGRTVVRSTNGGMTVFIDPNGHIQSMLEPFVEGYLVGDAIISDSGPTLYVRWGDWLAWVMIWLSTGGTAAAIVVGVMRRLSRRRLAAESGPRRKSVASRRRR
jgi:apolipoprotein N-acyltransferase